MNPLRTLGALGAFLICIVAPALAQIPQDAMASQSLRPYAHVFVAYAIAWLLIGGWIISINRRLKKLDGPAG